jgi:hypothetical protein
MQEVRFVQVGLDLRVHAGLHPAGWVGGLKRRIIEEILEIR